ncbi:MAG: ATP-binding protein [Pseudomonadaceae bacterium]|nr:ATP-binding protein [Pseudomonadaceae bacterium]
MSRPRPCAPLRHCLALGLALFLACSASASVAVDVSEFWDLPANKQQELEQDARLRGDTTRAALLRIARSVRLISEDPASSHQLLDSIEASAAYDDELVRAWTIAARCSISLLFVGDADVERRCEDAERHISDFGDNALIAWLEVRMGVLHYQRGQYPEAVQIGKGALMGFERLDWPVQHATAYNNLGLALRAQGLHRRALDHFRAGLGIVKESDHSIVEILTFNVGVSSMDIGLYDRAREYYDIALARAVDLKFLRFELIVRTYRAMLELRIDNPTGALSELSDVVADPAYEQYSSNFGHALGVYGEALMHSGQEEKAFAAYDRAFEMTRSVNSVLEARHVQLHFARILRLRGDLERSLSELDVLIPQLREDRSRELLIRALDEKTTVLFALGRNQEIPPVIAERRESERGLRDQRVESQLALLRADFDYAAQEAELKLLRQQQATADAEARYEQLSRFGLIAIGVLSGLLVYLVTNRLHVQRQRRAERAVKAELESQVAQRTADLEHQIEERDKAEAERRALELRLAEDDKLRVLGQLTGGVAHDFNNLLTVISGNAELLQSRVRASEDDSVALIRSILDAVDSGAGITRSLRAYARQEPMDLQPVEMVTFIRNALPMLRRSVGSLIDVRADLPRQDVFVRLDPSQLTTALLNLCLNSADAIDHTGEVLLSLQQQDDRVFLMVADNGRGMSPEAAARAIEPFFSTKDESRHGGLGLSMVYGFAKQLGGELRIESELGRGTEIWISLPATGSKDASDTHDGSGKGGRLSAADGCSGGILEAQ